MRPRLAGVLLSALCLVQNAALAQSTLIEWETPLYMSQGQVMVPARPVFQWLGAKVDQGASTQLREGRADPAGAVSSLVATFGDKVIRLRAGEHLALVNGAEFPIDARPAMEGSRVESREGQLFVPLAFLGEAIQVKVKWETTAGGFATLISDKREAVIARCPLTWAAASGRLETINLLLSRGAKVSDRTPSGAGALHWAAKQGQLDAARLLVDRGADVNVRYMLGGTPLHWAASSGRTAVVQLLLDRHAEVDAQDEEGQTPLHAAARQGQVETVKLLLDRAARASARSTIGWAPLHSAAAGSPKGCADVVRLLLDRGTDVSPLDVEGKTPLDWAVSQERTEAIKLLRDRGADAKRVVRAAGPKVSPSQPDWPGPLRVGIATADITPEGPVWLRGFGGRDNVKPSDGVARPLLAQCAVFDNGQTRVALIALDLCGLSYRQALKLRAAAESAGIPQQHLMINVSHTHFGPGLGDPEPNLRNLEYETLLTERLQGLPAAAVANLLPAVLDYAVGSCTMGCSRRRLDDKGRANWGPEPRKPIDMDVPVLRVFGADGQVRAVLFGYSCHPTTTGGRMMYLVDTDYPGYARDWIAAAYPGATPIFFQGCGGDIKPRAIQPGKLGAPGFFQHILLNERESKASVGHELGRAVVAATAVPLAGVPADRPKELKKALSAPVTLGGIVETVALPSKADAGRMHPTRWHMGAWRIGDVYFFGSQGELVSAIGRRIKSELPAVRLWANGYTHWGGGYFADAAAFAEGGYEVANMAFAPQAENILVGRALQYIKLLQTVPVRTEKIPRCHP